MDLPDAVEVWRGGRVESRHRVHVCVAAPDGAVVHALGDIASPVYPRSSLKPFQALALVESGAADAFGLDDAELALACSSHSGEPMHVERVDRWLGRLGLASTALVCGGELPRYEPAAHAMLRSGEAPTRAHDNCSGKHTGMLTTCRHLGLDPAGYAVPGGALQQRIAAAVAEVAGLGTLPEPGIDGCGAPVWPMPLQALATATARLARPVGQGAVRSAALQRIARAMRRHPEMVGGTGRCTTALMQALPEISAKSGAEGVYIAALHGPGLGLALKVEDGTGRAAETAVIACLVALGVVPPAARTALDAYGCRQVRTRAGAEVGRIVPAPGWPPFGRA